MDKEKLKNIPDLPGVYLMKGKNGSVLYIGKAASLKRRVSSYFQRESHLAYRTRLMLEKAEDISFIVTSSEAEALIAESALIKKYRPRYNVALKDDKSYPHLRLTVNEDYPRLALTRKLRDDGSVYYGPYTDVKLLRKALGIMKRIFPLRTCSRMPKKLCLNYHIGQCCAPCVKALDKRDYWDIVRELKLFLSGRRDRLIDELSKKMEKAAERQDYEKAAVFRNRIEALSVVPNYRSKRRRKEKFAVRKVMPYDEIVALRYFLGLKRDPRKIEAFDISNISGKEAVGSMITFIDGRPGRNAYRKFRIRDVRGIDDYRMMREIIRRRYERVKSEKLPCPDLIIIDGGKGQLNAASAVLKNLGFERIPVAGIAKRFDHIYKRGRREPIIFSGHSPVLHLIQRLRDEAHRFAISYHRLLRSKKLSKSALDGIKGVGEKRKMVLLNRFGSAENIRRASLEDLSSVKGIDEKIAERIKRSLA